MSNWTPQAIATVVTSLTAFTTAVVAGIAALKAHQKINDHYENDHTDMQNVDSHPGK